MKSFHKVAVVAGGYLAAVAIALAVAALNAASRNAADAQASSGMYTFADALLFVAVFGLCALVPTGVALFFLRPYRPFWIVLSACALAVAITGLTAVVLFAVARSTAHAPVATWADLSVLRILVAPLFTLTFLVCAAFSPHRSPRSALLMATVMEAAVSAYGGAVWIVPSFFQGT